MAASLREMGGTGCVAPAGEQQPLACRLHCSGCPRPAVTGTQNDASHPLVAHSPPCRPGVRPLHLHRASLHRLVLCLDGRECACRRQMQDMHDSRAPMLKESVQQKLCRRCNTTKPASGFHANRKGADGRQSWCKTCAREYLQAYLSARRLNSSSSSSPPS